MRDLLDQPKPSPAETAARLQGWEKKDSHFTRCGVSIGYVDWETLCREEKIAVPATRDPR